ncbi:MAG: DNA methyltransferase [Salinivirgaceae bacterium]
MKFSDIIYGEITLPEWLKPFLFIPEFIRLRGVRLSNIDSVDLKDFNTPTRWEHCIGAAYLALTYSRINNLSQTDEIHLTLASLLHDIGTPPYAHTVEYILSNFDHEEETFNLISGNVDDFSYESSSGGFHKQLLKLSESTGLSLDAEKIAEIVVGDGTFGFLLNGSIDIDNIDNLIRASFYSGIEIDKAVPINLINWISGFSNAPTELYSIDNSAVQSWLRYRNELYKKFYESKNDLGRQAFLQHIIRRAYNAGFPNKPIIYSTDDSLLSKIERFKEKEIEFEGKKYKYPISNYINKFRLVEDIVQLTSIPIETEDELRILSNPTFANWLELKLFNDTFEPFVLINKKRFKDSSILFDEVRGEICIYILKSSSIWRDVLPNWIKESIDTSLPNDLLINSINDVIKKHIKDWIQTKPWHSLNEFRIEDIKSNLEHEKDWSFKNDRNKNIHTYQATYVRTIPNRLISSLGLKGELIIDPFGGTGQTAEEALRLGCKAITSDVNAIANLATKTKFSYISKQSRAKILSITKENILNQTKYEVPEFDKIDKWHHPDTIIELSKIREFINTINEENISLFLKTCFSDILTSSTDRKGKGLSYFADNTPLPKGVTSPTYQPVIQYFINKIAVNLKTLENFYSSFERKRRNPEEELKKVKVIKADVREITPELYGIKEKEAAAIITSPPYLCMVDYTLGQRLSYNWLFNDDFKNDFKLEIGSRRKRTNSKKIYSEYMQDMEVFINNSKRLIRKDGYLITVIGEPKANAFKDFQILNILEDKIVNNGFKKIWEVDRPISWHRNHGISSLDKERISIYVLQE